ncbi:MAG: tetratricopeptide repeat protein [Acidobacteriota bacterium]|nr:tetratricopeptide repeat protein [Acidobacteriota bacterium]
MALRRNLRLIWMLSALAAAYPPPAARAQDSASRVCAGCHQDVWATYRRTGMGRSFYRPSPATAPETAAPYYHAPSASYFAMIRRGGDAYQQRYQLDAAGARVNVMEKRIDYVLGSGNHARTYLHRTAAGTLVELPLGWYAEKGGYWAMNPGYDRPDHDGFRRPITYDCMFCHNAYPAIPAGYERPFSEPVYSGALPEGIGCTRCHGPGERHVQLASTPGANPAAVRAAIVNPARLSPARQMEVCMVCHLETTSFPLPNAILRYDRGPFSYRPGEPMGDFLLSFDHAPAAGREDKFEIVNAAYRLRRSACFLSSGGKLLCTTCHNPHDIPRGAAARLHYDAVCRRCHAAAFDTLVASGRHTRADGCAECHMPKRRTEDVVHAVATDHYIQRRAPSGNLLAERSERHETGADAYRGPVVLYYPESLPSTPDTDLYLAAAQVKQGSNLAGGIPQLTAAIAGYAPRRAEFYLELAEALENAGQLDRAVSMYREAVRRDPAFAVAQQRLGTALRRSHEYPASAAALERAAALAPNVAVTWHELGLTDRALGRPRDAIAAIGKALALDPDFPEAHNNLGILRLAAGDRTAAEASFREAIRINPAYADAHGNLANLLSASGRAAEAREQFEIALRLRPADAAARYNYAMLLGRGGRYDDAARELEEALRADPGFADAHLLLGNLLMARGQTGGAIPHYREALRLRPGSVAVHLGLGAALAAAGDIGEAIPHLQKAAAAEDAATRAQASELLRRLRR